MPWVGNRSLLQAVLTCGCCRACEPLLLHHGNPFLPQFLFYNISLTIYQQQQLSSAALLPAPPAASSPRGKPAPCVAPRMWGMLPWQGVMSVTPAWIHPLCPRALQPSRGLKPENKTNLSETLVFVLFP